jgi:hypothetical protein
MFDIARLGKFHLAGGCHKETNANGDLCVNEAAILAAGFEHRAVRSADDCPPCFSRVISQYAIMLDDLMPDDLRNELLMPFVLRLAGTADSPEVERKRMRFIVVESVRRINSYVYRHILQHSEAAAQCEKVVLLCQAEAGTFARKARNAAHI